MQVPARRKLPRRIRKSVLKHRKPQPGLQRDDLRGRFVATVAARLSTQTSEDPTYPASVARFSIPASQLTPYASHVPMLSVWIPWDATQDFRKSMDGCAAIFNATNSTDTQQMRSRDVSVETVSNITPL
jgi:hypothetical protein